MFNNCNRTDYHKKLCRTTTKILARSSLYDKKVESYDVTPTTDIFPTLNCFLKGMVYWCTKYYHIFLKCFVHYTCLSKYCLSLSANASCEAQQGVFLDHNDSERFECRFVTVKVAASPSIMFRGMEGMVFGVWSAHGEGMYSKNIWQCVY